MLVDTQYLHDYIRFLFLVYKSLYILTLESSKKI